MVLTFSLLLQKQPAKGNKICAFKLSEGNKKATISLNPVVNIKVLLDDLNMIQKNAKVLKLMELTLNIK